MMPVRGILSQVTPGQGELTQEQVEERVFQEGCWPIKVSDRERETFKVGEREAKSTPLRAERRSQLKGERGGDAHPTSTSCRDAPSILHYGIWPPLRAHPALARLRFLIGCPLGRAVQHRRQLGTTHAA